MKAAADRLLRADGFVDIERGGPWTFNYGHHRSIDGHGRRKQCAERRGRAPDARASRRYLADSAGAAAANADRWRSMEHAVTALPDWWPRRARELLARYADTGNLVASAAELGFSRRRALTIVETFTRWRAEHPDHAPQGA